MEANGRGPSISGSTGVPLCCSASRATRRSRCTLPSSSPGRTTTCSLTSSTIRATPASVAWRTMRSIFLPFGKHCRRVSRTGRRAGGIRRGGGRNLHVALLAADAARCRIAKRAPRGIHRVQGVALAQAQHAHQVAEVIAGQGDPRLPRVPPRQEELLQVPISWFVRAFTAACRTMSKSRSYGGGLLFVMFCWTRTSRRR